MLPVGKDYDVSLSTGIYKSKDAVCNLKIRVKLEKETSEKKPTICEESPQREIELQSIPQTENEVEEKIITWQEKIFSISEINKYLDQNNCKTSLEMKYHDDVIKLTRNGMPQNRIFTCVDVDECFDKDVKDNSNFLIDRITNLRLRNIPKTEYIPKSNIVEPFPTRNTCEIRHVQQSPGKIMRIMANLNDFENLNCQSGEVILCQINSVSDGTILISPDFNDSNSITQPYRIEHNDKVFRWTLEHVSEDITEEELIKEKNQTLQNYYQHLDLIKNAIGDDFEMLPPDMLKVFLMGEIVSASNFGWTNLYINYMLELPSYWTTSSENQQLFGTTFTSSTTVENREDVVYFSYPFNIELILNINEIPEDSFIKFPQILLEVWSQDFWNRYRVKGYGYISIPYNPGVYKYEIQTWKPIYNDISGQLREFFLGSSSELDDLSFPSRAVSLEKEHPLSRLGLQTESSGSIVVKMNIIHQSMNFLQSDKSAASLRALFSKFGSTSIQASVLSVLEAFQRARYRMLSARKRLQSFSSGTKITSSDLTPSATTSTTTPTTSGKSSSMYTSKSDSVTAKLVCTSTSTTTSSEHVTSTKQISDSRSSTSKTMPECTSTSKTTSSEHVTSSTTSDYLPMSKFTPECSSTSKTLSSEHVTSSIPLPQIMTSDVTSSSFTTDCADLSSDTSKGLVTSRIKTQRIIPAIIHKTQETLSDVSEEDDVIQTTKQKSSDDVFFSPSTSEFDDTSNLTWYNKTSSTSENLKLISESTTSKSEARLRRRQKKQTLPALSDVRTTVPPLLDIRNIPPVPYSDSILERKSAKRSYKKRTEVVEGADVSGTTESEI